MTMLRLSSPNVTDFDIYRYSDTICFIYEHLWKEMGCKSVYRGILVNLIGDDLEEVIVPIGRDIYINVRYSDQKSIDKKTDFEKQVFSLEILQTGLLRLAEKDRILDITKLQAIKEKILERRFEFDITYKTFVNKKNDDLIAKVVVHPTSDSFDFYIVIEEKKAPKCNILIYRGQARDYYMDDFFSVGKWKGDEFVLGGKGSEIEFRVLANCKIEVINISDQKDSAPKFEAMKVDADKDKSLKDFLASLDPGIAAVLRNCHN